MGAPKAWLEFAGRPLLAHLVERLLTAFPSVIVVAARGQELPPTPAAVAYDDVLDEGPVAGIAAGLRAVSTPLAFVASCDLPLLNMDVAAHIVAQVGEHEAAVPEWEGRLQPLHAAYRASVAVTAAAELAAGHRRAHGLLDCLRVQVVPEAELRALDPHGHSFFNANTPEELERARGLWAERDNLAGWGS